MSKELKVCVKDEDHDWWEVPKILCPWVGIQEGDNLILKPQPIKICRECHIKRVIEEEEAQ